MMPKSMRFQDSEFQRKKAHSFRVPKGMMNPKI